MAKGKPSNQKHIRTPPQKELANIILGIIMGALIFSHDWLHPSMTFENFKFMLMPFTLSAVIYYLSQRTMSEKLRCNISYRLWMPGVVFSLLFMLIGIRVFLIGGILISAYKFGRWGMKDRMPSVQEIGFISVVGPLTSMGMFIIFKLAEYYFGYNLFFSNMALINGWLVFFNLIPIKELDGGKVMFWYPMFWIILMFFAILMITPSNLALNFINF